tara:strand:- start:350 stop:508 length:159 start_codon:yes stop_codon:yes gene_type:complete
MTTNVVIKQRENTVHCGIVLDTFFFLVDFEEVMIGKSVVIRYGSVGVSAWRI